MGYYLSAKTRKSRFVEMFGRLYLRSAKIDFSKICEFVTVGIANSATHAYSDSGVVMLRNQNIKENFLDDADIAYIKPDFAAKYHTKTLRENDLLIVRTGYPGVACLVPRKYEGAQTFTTLIARLKDCERTNPVYICHFINSEFGKQFVESKKVGIAQQNFGAKALGEMPMLIPDIALQHEFAAFVAEVDKSEFAVRKRLEKARQVYRAKLQEYFG